MSEEIKKVVINMSDLPAPSPDNKYYIRYRIISEDKSLTSDWSGVFPIDGQLVSGVNGSVTSAADTVGVVWGDENLRPKYDIFVRYFNNTETLNTKYEYHGTSAVHNYSFLKPTVNVLSYPANTSFEAKKVQVKIQVSNYDHSESLVLEIYESTNVNI